MRNGGEHTCDVFGTCGGCELLDVPYLGQLEQKNERIAKLFGGLCDEGALRPMLGMQHPFHYRNKVIAPFVPGSRKRGAGRGGPAILTGMYAKGTHRVVESACGCLLENETAAQVVSAVKAIMAKRGIAPYDEDAHVGFMRHAVVRVGHSSGEVLVVLVTNSDEFPYAKSFCRELVRRVPAVTTVVQSVNTRQTNVVLGERERTLWGPGFILDRLCGLSFRISAHSFYQVNAQQTEVLYEEAIGLARLSGSETVIDAYCGTGTIGLVAASRGAGRVIGVDSVEAAIRDARQNARHNGIENAEFTAEDATAFMGRLAQGDASGSGAQDAQGAQGEVVLFMDPPRAGATEEFLDAAARLAPDRIVYISCNPDTQVRDVRRLVGAGATAGAAADAGGGMGRGAGGSTGAAGRYAIDVVQPVDMFPHTPHIECICSLSRR